MENLSEVLKRELRELFGSVNDASRALGLNPGTFRQDLSRNKFAKADLEKIERLLLVRDRQLVRHQNTLQDTFKFDLKRQSAGAHLVPPKDLADLFAKMVLAQGPLRRYAGSALGIIEHTFGCAGKDDLFVIFVNDNFPTHWRGDVAQMFQTKILGALGRGLRILYLHPDAATVKSLGETAYFQAQHPAVVESRFDLFCQQLGDVSKNLCLLSHDCPAICVPHHFYMLFFHADQTFSIAILPLNFEESDSDQRGKVIVKFGKSFTERLVNIATMIFFKHLKAKDVIKDQFLNECSRFFCIKPPTVP